VSAEAFAIAVAPELLQVMPGLYVEAVVVCGARHAHAGGGLAGLEDGIQTLLSRWHRPAALDDLAREPRIEAYARLHRGLANGDPKTVPSVENLVGRYLARGRFPRIDPLVDAANVVSAEELRPVGVFDADRVAGEVMLDRARPGDTFVPLGKTKPEKIPPGSAILRDREKIFSMIGVRDSAETMVRPETENLLALSWGFEAVPRAEVQATVRRVADLLLGA
jgi:DNA/RNA-binding domain of Phe-tRNA-synthetase-like protein